MNVSEHSLAISCRHCLVFDDTAKVGILPVILPHNGRAVENILSQASNSLQYHHGLESFDAIIRKRRTIEVSTVCWAPEHRSPPPLRAGTCWPQPQLRTFLRKISLRRELIGVRLTRL